jgi:DNA recombination protein Rad52
MTEIPYTKQEELDISNNLQKFLGPEWLSHRNGPTGRLTYIEGKNAISLANEIFGFNGWSSEIKDSTVDFVCYQRTLYIDLELTVEFALLLGRG